MLSFAENSKAEKAFVETHGGNDGLEFCMMLLYSSGALAIYSQEQSLTYTANVNRQTTDKLLFSYAIITGKNV